MNTLWVIAYDIEDNDMRAKVADLLGNYGERVQYSVFECYLSAEQLFCLQQEIAVLTGKDDALRFYPLCRWCRLHIDIQGKGKYSEDTAFFIS